MCALALGSIGCTETTGTAGRDGGNGGRGGDGGAGGIGGAAGSCDSSWQCNDFEFCTVDVCVSGRCEYLPRSCNDFSECTIDSCELGVGCQHAPVDDGTPCTGGSCQSGACELAGSVLPCVEQAIRNAAAAGGGPYTFDCDGPTTITLTEGPIFIDKEVTLDGEGELTLDGDEQFTVVEVHYGASRAELAAIRVVRGVPGIVNKAGLTIRESVIEDNRFEVECMDEGGGGIGGSTVCTHGGGIQNRGDLYLVDSIVESNSAYYGGGVHNRNTMTVMNTTFSGNTAACGTAIRNQGTMTVINSTLSDSGSGLICGGRDAVVFGTIIDGPCDTTLAVSGGYNIESPGDTCRFDQPTDQVSVSADDLKLGPLEDNGGPTRTHALQEGSVAIDQIPPEECVDADGLPLTSDQRGVTRPQGDACDVGALETLATP